MKKIQGIVREQRLEDVIERLILVAVRGLTVRSGRGIFVQHVEEAVRIRTGERGLDAV
jgi:nitrogen regulatory protein PII